MKNIGNLFVRLFVISLLTFRYFSIIGTLFGAGAAPVFPAPALAPSKAFRRLRLQLRPRPKCVGSGSGSASLVRRMLNIHEGSRWYCTVVLCMRRVRRAPGLVVTRAPGGKEGTAAI